MVAAFDGGRITSDAGALPLGQAARVIGLTRRLAACFTDARDPELIKHRVETLVMQRVVGIALGYEERSSRGDDPEVSTLRGTGVAGERLRLFWFRLQPADQAAGRRAGSGRAGSAVLAPGGVVDLTRPEIITMRVDP